MKIIMCTTQTRERREEVKAVRKKGELFFYNKVLWTAPNRDKDSANDKNVVKLSAYWKYSDPHTRYPLLLINIFRVYVFCVFLFHDDILCFPNKNKSVLSLLQWRSKGGGNEAHQHTLQYFKNVLLKGH